MKEIVVIAHNIRSSYNIGSLLRTAEGLGIHEVLLTGYSPYPLMKKDTRLPHVARKTTNNIHKSALGAEILISWRHINNVKVAINALKADGYHIWAVEQHDKSIFLPSFRAPDKCVLLLGSEMGGIGSEILTLADGIVEVPMFGKKESYNVVQAAAMVMYHCRFS